MNIKIVDSWLREFLTTKATPEVIARELSLKSVSVDRVEKINNDYVYDIEVTTNRPDLMSVRELAREAAVVLEDAKFNDVKTSQISSSNEKFPIEIISDPKLINRICAAVLEVEIGDSPKKIKDRLEMSGIRSLNNLIDITNYVMREIGHPCHVFDFDLLVTKKMVIRESKKDEQITTLDDKEYSLLGGDIVADDGNGKIIDLLGIMGTKNSVVRENTKRILFFLDNNNPQNIRRTSMSLGIRSEAAIINEKGIDPELMMKALCRGIELYQQIAKGKVISEILDLYPNKSKIHTIKISNEKINKIIGVEINPNQSAEILEKLGFRVKKSSGYLEVQVHTIRSQEVLIDEDLIEEIARIYGYHNLPNKLPKIDNNYMHSFVDEFFWERKVKEALKYWGFVETYTYSFVSEDMYEGPTQDSVEVSNPLTKDFVYMRNSLIPSLLKVVSENKKYDDLKIFEIANIYTKKEGSLPNEKAMLSGILKKENASFYQIKGLIEQMIKDLGIENLSFKKSSKSSLGASLYIEKDYLGEIEILDTNLVDFELDFSMILKHASVKKEYKPFAKYPPMVEDLSVIISSQTPTEEIIKEIKAQSEKVIDVSLANTYENTRTFHIIYQDLQKNMTKEEVLGIRNKIISSLKESFSAKI